MFKHSPAYIAKEIGVVKEIERRRHWAEVCRLIATLPNTTPSDETWQELRKWLKEEIRVPLK